LKLLNLLVSKKANIKPELVSFFSLLFINSFILSYFSISILWLWANNLKTIKRDNSQSKMLIKKLSPIVTLMGWEQNWGLFCPNIRSDNHYNLVVMTLQNGFLKLCEMPRMEKLNVLQKAQQEKFRKIFNDNFPYPDFLCIRPALSRFLANAAYNKYNPPARLAYFLVTEPVPTLPAPPATTSPVLSARTPPVNKMSQKENDLHPAIINYFVYGVSPNDFE
jgi:hypothetical protein